MKDLGAPSTVAPAGRAAARSIAFVASDAEAARDAAQLLAKRYGAVAPERADVIVALGGDGFMLETLHKSLPARDADLRHESRQHRLPAQRVPRRTA